jgi:hypothetical protein
MTDNIFKEYLYFIKKDKKWYLLPLLLLLALLGGIFTFLQTSALAPFLYPLF